MRNFLATLLTGLLRPEIFFFKFSLYITPTTFVSSFLTNYWRFLSNSTRQHFAYPISRLLVSSPKTFSWYMLLFVFKSFFILVRTGNVFFTVLRCADFFYVLLVLKLIWTLTSFHDILSRGCQVFVSQQLNHDKSKLLSKIKHIWWRVLSVNVQ